MTKCPACLLGLPAGDRADLAAHFVERADASDPDHVRWLNQNLSRKRIDVSEVERRLASVFDLGGAPLSRWVIGRFVERFYGAKPHPFVLAMQRPTRAVLLGYVVEHQHFLRQWVRSCALIAARTDDPDVARYEIENLVTEFLGEGSERPAHYELLLRMGEALGLARAEALATPPLPSTRRAIAGWQRIASDEPWVAAMAAMHGLELIAHRNLRRFGASVPYFDPALLEDPEVPEAARAFLREGYEADVGHSEAALELVARHVRGPGTREAVQAVFLRSLDLFDDYLVARLERGEGYAGR